MGKWDKEGGKCFTETGTRMKANGGVIKDMVMGFIRTVMGRYTMGIGKMIYITVKGDLWTKIANKLTSNLITEISINCVIIGSVLAGSLKTI